MLDSDRWRDVERIFHAAVACEGHQRAELVRRACAGDEALRQEVDSLLEYDGQEHPFLSAPAIELLDSCLSLPPCIAAGQRIGPYEIVSLLGSGGMGDVYRARDTKLARDVAIKILPDVFAEDAGRAARFEREARLLAALNHPHIAAIYGLEDRDGLHGLVLELVEGQTLAARLREGPLPPRAGVCDRPSGGRCAACGAREGHRAPRSEAGEHRDHPDGVVKVLDFGLAKYVAGEVPGEPPSADAPPSANDVSATDGIVGTAAYMSPEQARRATVDERTDVWAFGCVLWAMLTGRARRGHRVRDDRRDSPSRSRLAPSAIRHSRRDLSFLGRHGELSRAHEARWLRPIEDCAVSDWHGAGEVSGWTMGDCDHAETRRR
jgi:eukaryotic-like serine/threonine-protein kinase